MIFAKKSRFLVCQNFSVLSFFFGSIFWKKKKITNYQQRKKQREEFFWITALPSAVFYFCIITQLKYIHNFFLCIFSSKTIFFFCYFNFAGVSACACKYNIAGNIILKLIFQWPFSHNFFTDETQKINWITTENNEIFNVLNRVKT